MCISVFVNYTTCKCGLKAIFSISDLCSTMAAFHCVEESSLHSPACHMQTYLNLVKSSNWSSVLLLDGMAFALDNAFFSLMVTAVLWPSISLSVSVSTVIYSAPVSLRLFICVGVAFLFHSPGFQRCSSCTPVRHLPCQSRLVPSVPLAKQLHFCSLASLCNSPHICFSALSLHPHSISLACISVPFGASHPLCLYNSSRDITDRLPTLLVNYLEIWRKTGDITVALL